MSKQIEIVKKAHQSDVFNAERFEELKKCSEDVIYFIEKYLKIQHPRFGRVPFKLYPFQREMIKNFATFNRNIVLTGRQQGKTQTSAAFLLWRAMFSADFTILITANKYNQALEIMDRIRYMYENMEDFNWLRAGVIEYNKGTISFDNGSKIMSRATSRDSARGLSISLLFSDELGFVPTNIQAEFQSSIQPTLATGGAAIFTSTPNSDTDMFSKLWFGAINTMDEFGIDRDDGIGINGFKAYKATWRDHPDRDAAWAATERASLGDATFRREYEAEFISVDETLINGLTLATMQGVDETFRIGETRWYQEPKPNMTYVVTLDPSLGTGRDYAAIQVLELPTMIQVAEWKHNLTPTKGQVSVLMEILGFISYTLNNHEDQLMEPEIYWTVENNAIGEAALVVINETGEDEFPGTFVSEPKRAGQGRRRKGLTTTARNKLVACMKLKSLIESNRMKVNSKALIYELKTFVSNGASASAKPGTHDDLVSATLLALRLSMIVANWSDSLENAMSDSILEDNEDYVEPLPYSF